MGLAVLPLPRFGLQVEVDPAGIWVVVPVPHRGHFGDHRLLAEDCFLADGQREVWISETVLLEYFLRYSPPRDVCRPDR